MCIEINLSIFFYCEKNWKNLKEQHQTIALQEMCAAFEKEFLEQHKTRLLITAIVAGVISIIEPIYEIPEL